MARSAHHGVQAPHDAGRPCASAAAREVSGHRHPQPPADSHFGGRFRSRRDGDGAEQPPPAGQPERRLRRDRLKAGLEAIRTSKYPDRMVLFANVDFRDVGPGFGAKAAAQLEAGHQGRSEGTEDFQGPRPAHSTHRRQPAQARRSGARSDLGGLRPSERARPHPHGEPQEFFEPITYQNERWLELALFSDRRYPPDQAPRFEELIGERDRMFARHPKTRFIAAHFAYHANDLARMGALLDRLPNVYPEVAAILAELGRQPRAAHDFFVKYQDRVLFGKDSYQPDEYPYLLAHVRDRRRVLRLLPRLPRVLEAVRHGSAGRRAEEALLQERLATRAGTASGGFSRLI